MPPLAITPEVVRAIENAQIPAKFVRICKIQTEDSEPGYLDPTPTQMFQLDAMAAANWTLTLKYRQAKITTLVVMDLLRHTMFNPLARGVLIAEKEKTGEEAFSRLALAYKYLDDIIKVPVDRDPTRAEMRFSHDGFINIITGGGDSPSIGHSPDYAHITEYGEFKNYDTFNGHFFPSVNKRANGKLRIESTPGPKGSAFHDMWLKALDGKGRFRAPRGRALFLAWWHDDTCVSPPTQDFRRTPEEEKYAQQLLAFEAVTIKDRKEWYPYKAPRPISDAHLQFRRDELDTTFHGDTRLFNAKYPSDPWSCWITDGTPHIPQDAIDRQRMLPGTRSVAEGEEALFEQREPGAPYLLTCDPAGFGQTGDPSAWTLWHGWDRREVGCFSGRIDPGRLADRIMHIQKLYDCDVIVEANKGECCQALLSRGCPKLVWDKGQPGWYSTDISKGSATTLLVDMLRAKPVPEIRIVSNATLDQLDTWDGTSRRTKTGHHFDRAITCIIGAYGMRRMGYPQRAVEIVQAPRPAGVTWKELEAMFPEQKKRVRAY